MAEKIALVVRGLFELSDSIGYDCVAQYQILAGTGGPRLDLRIFAENINPNNYPEIPIEHVSRLKTWLETSQDATVIYHWCDGWPYLDSFILSLPCRLIIRWHNNTPPWFYTRYSMTSVANTIRGFDSLLQLAQVARVEFWVNSVYTARQLAFFGIDAQRIHVVYPLSPFLVGARKTEPAAGPSAEADGALQLLFVGRAVPHKGHKHLVAIAAMVQHAARRKVRLTMVGRLDGSTARYVEETRALAASLSVDAAIPGELPFAEVSRIYRASNVFVCFSEHEGFGLPIFEAMRVGLPVVGLRSTAVGEFLHAHPLAVASVDYAAAAARVIAATEPAVRDAVIDWQRENVLRHYSQDIVAAQLGAGLHGHSQWPTFGGARSPAIEQEVAAVNTRLGSRLDDAAAALPALRQIPFDTVDRFVTRYDLDSFRLILAESQRKLEQNDFIGTALAAQGISHRRLMRLPIHLLRRVVLSLQLGLLYAMQRVSSETREEFRRLERTLEDIGGSLHSLRVALVNRPDATALTPGSTFGDLAGTFGADYFNGGESVPERSYSRDARTANRALALELHELFQPQTSLEVGCAVGHCVEALRELGVDAFGYDISDWAVEQAAALHVRRFDIAAESIPGRYDLVIAYDVLHEVPPARLKFAVGNIWQACTRYLVVVLPFHTEASLATDAPTHLVRRDRRWWTAFLEDECGLTLDPLATAALDRSEHSQRFGYRGRVFVARRASAGLEPLAARSAAIPDPAVGRHVANATDSARQPVMDATKTVAVGTDLP